MKRIAVIGATGMLGAPVTKQLGEAGFQVAALVRDTRRATHLGPSVTLVKGDVRDMAGLTRLLEKQDALYVSLSVKPGERKNDFHTETDGLRNIIDVARNAGIRRIAFVSSLAMRYQGMNDFYWWVFHVKRNAVDLIKGSGIPYTIFYPSTFMENFQVNFRRGNLILLAGNSHHKMYFIAAEDFGRQVAQSFLLDSAANAEYSVQGLEGFTMDEAADTYSRHYVKGTLRIVRAPISLLKFMARFSATVDYGVNITEALNCYPETFESDQTWKDLGLPKITLAEFASKSD